MKRRFFFLTLLSLLLPMMANAYDAYVDGIYYNFSGNEAEVTYGNNQSGSYSGGIVIPKTVVYNSKTYKVTSVGRYAFNGCSGLTSVTIPNSVTTIGDVAFAQCYALTSVTIPYGVTSIGDDAFEWCYRLNSITIPSSVKSIGHFSFCGCSGLTSLTLKNGLTTIGQNAFELCERLRSVTIPKSVTSIGLRAFIQCYELTSIKVENGNSYYDSRNDCNAIIKKSTNTLIAGCQNTVIPNSVKVIDWGAFMGCTKLTSITIPKSVTSIHKYAFSECHSLISINVEEGNTTYDSRNSCNAIIRTATNTLVVGCKNTIIPKSVTSIGTDAFDDCGMTSITIPNSVTSIGDRAFYHCSDLTSVIIPESVTSIGNSAFCYCWNLTSVIIPNSVTSIGSGAFQGCTKLMRIMSFIKTPFTINSVFDSDTYNTATLYVPAGTVGAYQSTNGWKDFKNIKPISFKVDQTKVIREPETLHVQVSFLSEPLDYTSLDDYVSLSSLTDSLRLLSFKKTGTSWDLYFEKPKKEGTYTLKIANTLMDTNNNELDINENLITEEEDDNYIEEFTFGGNELYVIAQSPVLGVKGETGYTDVVFNEDVGEIPLSHVSLVSPTGKKANITSIEYIDQTVPARHRVYYDALEEEGRYVFTISNGLKSTKGKEMYYDYQSTIDLPCADLKPTGIEMEGNCIVNHQQTITYQVTNNGTMPATGKSVDVIYLSKTEHWNMDEAIEIYRGTVDVNLEPQISHTKTVDFTIPPCAEGKYYLILKTNVTRTINELSYDDNMLTSEPLNISVDYLSDKNNQLTLARGESRLFKVPVVSDENIEVQDKHGVANMYLGYYDMPNTNDEPRRGNVTIISPDVTMTYYLLVTNNSQNQEKVQPCELGIRQFDIEIASVGRANVVKHKTAWIPIEVTGCADMPIFYLTNKQGHQTECKNVYAKSESLFYAQFDTEILQTGTYDLYVECEGRTGMIPDAITVTQEEAQPSISSKLVLPSTSRIGSTITAYIDYQNTGNVDLPAPLFILTGQEGSIYELPTGGTYTSEAHIIGVNENGVVSALLPGESNRISVNITIPNQHIYTADYKLKTITESCDGIDEPFYLQWLDVEPNETPSCYTDEEWSAYCTRLRNNVGDTWRTFIQALGRAADLFYTDGEIIYDANCLYSILKEADLEEIQHSESETNDSRRRIADSNLDVEPGTIYIWSNDSWLPLVEAVCDTTYVKSKGGGLQEQLNLREWKRTDNCSKLTSSNSSEMFFISHGMNNDHHEEWIEKMAKELSDKGQIICVDWGRWAKNDPWTSAIHISEVSSRVLDALYVAFNRDPHLNRFHLIGHSHGAHVCGRLANKYHKKNYIHAKRITALDASTEFAHMLGSQLETKWEATYIDYYKSSVTCGTKYLAGKDNFILASGNSKFTHTGLDIMGEDIIRHSYAYDWFTQTINNNTELGFNWYENRSKHPKVKNHKDCWAGVINGPKNIIENYTNKEKEGWNYTQPWYMINGKKKKESEWVFRTAFASTIDYKPKKLEHLGSNNYIQAGTTELLNKQVYNNADNLTVPLEFRMGETQKHAVQMLFVSKKTNDQGSYSCKKDDKDIISYVNTTTNLYYLSERVDYITPDSSPNKSFSFNITPKLWKDLGGTNEIDSMDCDFWLISAVDASSNYRNSPTRRVKLWRGELYPSDNCMKVTLKVRKPNMSCEAGNDQTIKLKKGETTTNISVHGTVKGDNGKQLSYRWEKGNSVFSMSKDGNIALGVGKHTLTFRVFAGNGSDVGPYSFDNDAKDDVVITIEPYTPGDEEEESTSTAFSWDPNEKVGIKGAGGKACVKPGETMEYSIYFENDAEKAQLAAQTVTVIDTLDTAFDLTTFEFMGSEVANTYIDIPTGKEEVTVYTDMRPDNNLILKTDMKLDIDTRVLKVVYSSLDTLTNEPTQDVFAGFLPPNDSTHVGEGHFSYRVKLKDDVADGYTVKNQAHIFFDYNDEIATNTTCHVVDSQAPISCIEGLPSSTIKDSLLISWSGIDEGAGIRYYDIYRSKNGGNFELWKWHVTDNSAIQSGTIGDIYAYYSVATDSLGIVETKNPLPEATVRFVGNEIENMFAEKGNVSIEYLSGEFIITGAKGATCNVFDMAGQLVASKRGISHRQRIAFTRKGTFIVSVDTLEGITFAKKFVVNIEQ